MLMSLPWQNKTLFESVIPNYLINMANIDQIFKRITEILNMEYDSGLIANVLKDAKEENNDFTNCKYMLLKEFLQGIFEAIDSLSKEIENDQTLLISVKNQKLLQTCFQLIVSFGISQCLIPGLGISLSKRCISTKALQHITMNDEEKYKILVACTDFFTRSYNIPILRNIIITFHLCDYLASLIQLSFAPLKKPGSYANFTMTQEMYEELNEDKRKYVQIYEQLVNNCFQPILMKELLVLQNVTDRNTPGFVKKVIAKEMSRRLIASGGLLSLIRCFLESYDGDTGIDWKKIYMISKIVTSKHGNMQENDYLKNITLQLRQILTLQNVQYLGTAITCVLNLSEIYPHSEYVRNLKIDITQCFDTDMLLSKSLPGTIVLTAQEVERNIKILHCTTCVVKYEWDERILCSNLYVLYLLAMRCSKTEMKSHLKDIVLKCIALLDETKLHETITKFLYGPKESLLHLSAEEFDAGVAIKCTSEHDHPKQEALAYFIELFNSASNNSVVQKLLNTCLYMFTELNENSKKRNNIELLTAEETIILLNDNEEKQASILQLLSEISSSPNAISAIKSNPFIVLDFVERLLVKVDLNTNEEYVTVALILLNTILANINKGTEVEKRLLNLVPALKKLAESQSSYNTILCNETLSLISTEYPKQVDSAFAKVMLDVYDDLLPVRAHGIMELTKLIDLNDSETISKRHFIFCLLQEQLKDQDSYIYLSVINAMASLATHCTENVLGVLCREFLQMSRSQDALQTYETENNIAELRVKVGDIIVKVTKRLGEMAIVHKATLLNTMLCACRDEDHLIRTSALSNLAEIALVLHYKLGTILYEVLLCICCTIETDKAVECRRAAVMVISNLLKGLGKSTLIELKESLLPIYRSLMKIYKDDNEDSVIRLHAQIALEELDDIVKHFLNVKLTMERQFVLSEPKDIIFK